MLKCVGIVSDPKCIIKQQEINLNETLICKSY